MKCPACVEAGLASRFDEHHGPKQQGTVGRYFDEEGRRHVHDTTVFTIVMTCTNGHAFKSSFRSRCVCRDCAWNELPVVKAGEMKIGESTRGVAPRGAVDAA
jgi:hypothetical protein